MIRMLYLLLLLPSTVVGQEIPPLGRDARIDQPAWGNTRANAPIPPSLHKRNEGGSDGQGLCVIASAVTAGRYQGVPNLDALWAAAKQRPGGYGPQKLDNLLGKVMPDEKYVSYVGTDPRVLVDLNRSGVPVNVTMNTGSLYNNQRIAHMVTGAHFDDKLACIVDNNEPGKYCWMSIQTFLKRWVDFGTGWAFAWTRKPVQPNPPRPSPSPGPGPMPPDQPSEVSPAAAMLVIGLAALIGIGATAPGRVGP